MRQRHMQAGWDDCEMHFAGDLWTLLPGKSIPSWILVVLIREGSSSRVPSTPGGTIGELSLVGGQRPKKQKHACFLPLLMGPVSASQPGLYTRADHVSTLEKSAMNAG